MVRITAIYQAAVATKRTAVKVESRTMIAFCLSVMLLLVTPGPGVQSTAGVGAAFGFNAGLRYVTGLFIGTNVVALIVVSGLAAVILTTPWARNMLLVASACYLCISPRASLLPEKKLHSFMRTKNRGFAPDYCCS